MWNRVFAFPLRTFIASASIAVGICLIIAVSNLGGSVFKQTTKSFDQLGSHVFLVSPRRVAQHPGSVRFSDAELLRRTSGVTGVAESFRLQAYTEACGKAKVLRLVATDSTFIEIGGWSLKEGRFFSNPDVRRQARVAVIGAAVADEFACLADQPWVRISGNYFRVIGSLGARGSTDSVSNDDIVVVPSTTAVAKYGARLTGSVVLTIHYSKEVGGGEMRSNLRRQLRRAHGLSAGMEDDFDLQSPQEIQEAYAAAVGTLVVVVSALVGTALVVAGLGIFNTMLGIVAERTSEVGLRRSVGATRRHIAFSFLAEAVLYSLIGAVGGLASGTAVSWVIGIAAGLPFYFHVKAAGAAVVVCCAVGLCAGTVPALRAAAIAPYEALRHE
jgi:putative ABC transport system permease protein